MKFAYDFTNPWIVALALAGVALLIVFAVLLVTSAVVRRRAIRRFGEEHLVMALTSHDASARRTLKGVLLVIAVGSAFTAFARPQFGRGTRLVPATNLDVVVVLDYSKSMYARDVAPNRIQRAKAEVARLIKDLPGARFGAVAFAGEPMSFPLTTDGAAIAQFFRQLEPNDMPIGGTATARALDRARGLLSRDPKAKEHARVIVLVTDGEDLEGDPLEVARSAAQDGITIDVVQIGSRVPEVIPEIGPEGNVVGTRKDEKGNLLTTELSAEGEAQLSKIAETTGGTIVRSEHGETGIAQVAKALSQRMREELSEKVETLYAEEYAWPLGLALVLLFIEACLGESPQRRRNVAKIAGIAGVLLATSCHWDPSRPFERESPEVNRALLALDAGDASAAAEELQAYLSTGPCKDGQIGVPDGLVQRADSAWDLGIVLFQIGESIGMRFGEEEDTSGNTEETRPQRGKIVDCGLRVVRTLAASNRVPLAQRAYAHYLEGNLNFLDRQYKEAVKAYDEALFLMPGVVDGGDAVGRDAAWNRAIALRRIEEQERDAGPPPPSDGGKESNDGSPPENKPDGGNRGDDDAGQNNGPEDGGGSPPEQPDGGAAPPSEPPPPARSNQDERVLDQFEDAPMVQQEAARKQAQKHKVHGTADK